MSFHAPWRLRQGRCRNSEHATTINYNRPQASALHLYLFLWENKQSWSVSPPGPPAETSEARRQAGAGGRLRAKVLLCRLNVSRSESRTADPAAHKKKSSSTWKQTGALVNNLCAKSQTKAKTTVETFEILVAPVAALQEEASVKLKEKYNRIN